MVPQRHQYHQPLATIPTVTRVVASLLTTVTAAVIVGGHGQATTQLSGLPLMQLADASSENIL